MKKSNLILILTILIILGMGGYFLLQKEEIKEVKVGLLLPFSGALADYGSEGRDGIMMAINEFNAKQNKIKVIAVAKDQEGYKEKTELLAQELIDDEKVVGILGPIISSNTLAAGAIAQKGGIVLISPSATNPKVSDLGDYVFRTCPSDDWQGKDLAEFAKKDLGAERIAVLYQIDEDYSKGLAEVFKEEIVKLGGELVGEEVYSKEDTDFEKQVMAIKEKNADLIFVPGYTKQGILIAQQMEKLEMKSQFLGGDGIGGTVDFVLLGGKAVEGAIATAFFDVNLSDAKTEEFVRGYKRNYDKEPGWVAAHSYDAARVLLEAISDAKKTTREEIRDLVAGIKDYPGVTGNITFDENGDPVNKKILKLIVKEGKWLIFNEK